MFKSDRSFKKFPALAAPAAALILTFFSVAVAHDIPNEITVQAFLKPEGRRLRLVLRVPLKTMRDIDFPLRGPGYVDLERADRFLRDGAKLWISDSIELFEGESQLPKPEILHAIVSLPSERSFAGYEEAVGHVAGPRLPNDTEIHWDQAMLDVLFEYPIRSDRSRFAIDPNLERLGLRVNIVLMAVQPDGSIRAFDLHGDPGLVQLDPRWYQAALTFVELGFFHILDGIDHLLFLFCLVIPFRRLRSLIIVVTSFTVAHSVTLIASAYDFAPSSLWFPPLVETLIATSIVYMALENIVGSNIRRRWVITFAFGLVHGFGFSFALRETLQFAGSHLVTSLLAFNAGVELGQLLVLVVTLPALEFLFRKVVDERIGTIILSAMVAHTGLHWVGERFAVLRQFPWPELNAAFLASAMRWMLAIVILAAFIWILTTLRITGRDDVDHESTT